MGESSSGPVWCEGVFGELGLGEISVLVCVVLCTFLREISVLLGVNSVWGMSWFRYMVRSWASGRCFLADSQ